MRYTDEGFESAIRSLEGKQNALQSNVERLNDIAERIGERIIEENRNTDGFVVEVALDMNRLEARIKELEGRLEDSDKMTQLRDAREHLWKKDGWINGGVRKPKDYKTGYELMKGGVIISDPNQGGWSQGRGWTLGFPNEYGNLEGEGAQGVYWRPLNPWKSSTPENLASLEKGIRGTIVEVKLRDGQVHNGFLNSGYYWHIMGKECAFGKGTAKECANITTEGTWFRNIKQTTR